MVNMFFICGYNMFSSKIMTRRYKALPLKSNSTSSYKQMNRRVEVTLVDN